MTYQTRITAPAGRRLPAPQNQPRDTRQAEVIAAQARRGGQ